MANALQEAGFYVDLVTNAKGQTMVEVTRRFAGNLGPGDVALFYYSGHGAQYHGDNYLVPVDEHISKPSDLEFQAYNVKRLLGDIDAARSGLNLIVLDACWSNPFPKEDRGASSLGLVQMDAPSGTLISYATAPDRTASDATESHGLFTEELLRNITRPGRGVHDELDATRTAVRKRSNGSQIPWDESSLERNFFFYPPGGAGPKQGSKAARAVEQKPWRQAWSR